MANNDDKIPAALRERLVVLQERRHGGRACYVRDRSNPGNGPPSKGVAIKKTFLDSHSFRWWGTVVQWRGGTGSTLASDGCGHRSAPPPKRVPGRGDAGVGP